MNFFISENLPDVFVIDLIKARSHKYLRKYKRGNRWIYIYHEPNQKPKAIDDETLKRIKRLAELGNERAKKIVEEMEEVPHEKVDLLQRLATGFAHTESGKRAKETLEGMGIPVLSKEEFGLDDVRVEPPKDTSEKEFESPQKKEEFLNQIKSAVNQSIFGHLQQHQNTDQFKRLNTAGITLDSVMTEVQKGKSIKEVLEKLHEQMKKVDEVHAGLTHQNDTARRAGGYGNHGFNTATQALESSERLPAGFGKVLTDARASGNFKVPTLDDHVERMKQQEREREERERRELAELHGSMAHFISTISSERMDTEKIKRLDRTIRNIFGKSLRKEDWPYDFSAHGMKTKIGSVSVGENSFSLEMEVKKSDGSTVTDGWSRHFRKSEDGRPLIENAFLRVVSDARTGTQLGNIINANQRRLMRSLPNGGIIHVHANIDVGGYTWANQGFSWDNNSQLNTFRRNFQMFLRENGIHLSDDDMKKFKEPCHFSSFHDGKKYLVNTRSSIKLSELQLRTKSLSGVEGEHTLKPEEIANKKSNRMLVHLGKKFMLNTDWYGTWDSKQNTEASVYADRYSEMRERAVEHLSSDYQAIMSKVKEGGRTTPQPQRTEITPRASVGVTTDLASRYINYWQRQGRRNITITKNRARRILSLNDSDFNSFVNNAPLTTTAKRNLIERRREMRGGV